MEVSSSSITINSLFSVSGKNVLITGGSRGIGLMIAKTFVLAGANVLLTSRSEQACKDATDSIIRDADAAAAATAAAQQNHNLQSSQNPINTRSIRSNQNQNQKVQYVASNVSNRDGCEELAKYTAKIFNNKLDILINNAGSSWGEPLERTSGKANWGFDKVLDLNIKGVFYLTRACIPLLENAVTSSKDPSRIINIGSVVGMIPQAVIKSKSSQAIMEVSSSSITINSLFSVSGKNVLITGGSRGIGLMIAKTFVLAGANVLLTSRSEQACKDATDSIIRDADAAAAATAAAQQNHNLQSSQNPINTRSIRSNQNQNQKVQYVASNVSNRDGCEELAKYTAKIFNNKLDILINNAGSSWGEPLERTSGKANWGFDKVLDLNIKGVFYLTRACIPLLENAVTSSKDPSRIINIGSVVGMIPQAAPTYAYDASKAAVHSLTKKLAGDLASKHITCNALAPGFVETRMSSGLKTWGATTDKLKKSIPLGRMGNENDMAGACIYLSSKAGSYLTGVILNVDGGSVGAIQIDLGSDSNL